MDIKADWNLIGQVSFVKYVTLYIILEGLVGNFGLETKQVKRVNTRLK